MFPAVNAKTDHFTYDSVSICQAVAETKRERSMEAGAPDINIAFSFPLGRRRNGNSQSLFPRPEFFP